MGEVKGNAQFYSNGLPKMQTLSMIIFKLDSWDN